MFFVIPSIVSQLQGVPSQQHDACQQAEQGSHQLPRHGRERAEKEQERVEKERLRRLMVRHYSTTRIMLWY